MSCDFDLICVECGVEAGYSDLNWRCDDLVSLLKYRRQLEPTGMFQDPALSSFFFDSGRLGTAVIFFSEHVGHEILVKSEYGDTYVGKCPKNASSGGFCGLEKDHDGPCLRPEKTWHWDPEAKRYRHVPETKDRLLKNS